MDQFWSTQPFIINWWISQVPAVTKAGVKAGDAASAGWQVTRYDPIWHAGSRSDVMLLAQTAIHLYTSFTFTQSRPAKGLLACKNLHDNRWKYKKSTEQIASSYSPGIWLTKLSLSCCTTKCAWICSVYEVIYNCSHLKAV